MLWLKDTSTIGCLLLDRLTIYVLLFEEDIQFTSVWDNDHFTDI